MTEHAATGMLSIVAEGEERIGAVIAGSYRLVRLIGEGGMGAVYEAEHLRVRRKFAVKLLKPEIAADREMFDRFRREAEIASASGHEHIVEVIDFNVLPDGAPYMVLELLEGETVAQRIARRGRLNVDETMRLVDAAARALHVVHEKGVVHRDLKPQNLFLIARSRRDDFLKILDFGISKVVHDTSLATRDGQVLGTPNYMSPEQLAGLNDCIDARTDVFALGAIAWECLAGRVAFGGPSVPVVVYQICHAEPPSLRTIAPDVDAALEAVIARALAKRRDDRWPTALAFRDAFLRACGKSPSEPPARPGVVVQSGDAHDVVGPTIPSGRALADPSAPTLSAQSSDLREATPRRARARSIVAIVAAVIAAGVFVIVRNARQSSPSAVPSSAPATSAPPVSKVELKVTVEPASAAIKLDGVAIAPPLSLPRDDATHVLLVEAEGYVPVTRTFVADRDRDIQLVLARASQPPSAPSTVESAAKTTAVPAKPSAAKATAAAAASSASGVKPKIEIKGPMEDSL